MRCHRLLLSGNKMLLVEEAYLRAWICSVFIRPRKSWVKIHAHMAGHWASEPASPE